MSGRMIRAEEAETYLARPARNSEVYPVDEARLVEDLAHTVVQQARQIAAVLALHEPYSVLDSLACSECVTESSYIDWPCPTAQALGAES